MKKLGLILPLLGVVFASSFIFAQDVGGITVNFCNKDEPTKNLSIAADAGKDSEICIDFMNQSDTDVNITYGFVDGTVTADEYKNKACKNEGDMEKFGQYVRQDATEVLVPAGQAVRQKAYVKFPAGLSGVMNGCLTYYVKNDSEGDGSMFNVLIRKANFIDVLVGGNLKRSLQLAKSNPVSYIYDEASKSHKLEISLDNLGNVDENVTISGTISNSFGYKADFSSAEMKKIVSDSSDKMLLNVGKLPRYKMNYKVDLNIVSDPVFVFSSDLVPENLREPTNINVSLSIFLFPWALVYCLLGLIVLIFLIRFLAKHLSFK